jgi:hypothetical protein
VLYLVRVVHALLPAELLRVRRLPPLLVLEIRAQPDHSNNHSISTPMRCSLLFHSILVVSTGVHLALGA